MTSCLLSVFSLILYTILDQYKRSGLFFGILRPPYFENIRWNRSEGYTHNLLFCLYRRSIIDTVNTLIGNFLIPPRHFLLSKTQRKELK
jgi:hypothetical protein